MQHTHCRRGHELTDDNIYIWRDKRTCRRCKLETQHRYYQRRAPQRRHYQADAGDPCVQLFRREAALHGIVLRGAV